MKKKYEYQDFRESMKMQIIYEDQDFSESMKMFASYMIEGVNSSDFRQESKKWA